MEKIKVKIKDEKVKLSEKRFGEENTYYLSFEDILIDIKELQKSEALIVSTIKMKIIKAKDCYFTKSNNNKYYLYENDNNHPIKFLAVINNIDYKFSLLIENDKMAINIDTNYTSNIKQVSKLLLEYKDVEIDKKTLNTLYDSFDDFKKARESFHN